jgi:hypothetical protein
VLARRRKRHIPARITRQLPVLHVQRPNRLPVLKPLPQEVLNETSDFIRRDAVGTHPNSQRNKFDIPADAGIENDARCEETFFPT